jgi:hypothetical protein
VLRKEIALLRQNQDNAAALYPIESILNGNDVVVFIQEDGLNG